MAGKQSKAQEPSMSPNAIDGQSAQDQAQEPSVGLDPSAEQGAQAQEPILGDAGAQTQESNPGDAADKDTQTLSLRPSTTVEQDAQAREQASAAGKGERVLARVANSDGRMWDPDHSQWVEGDRPTSVTLSDWLQRQISAKKILLVK